MPVLAANAPDDPIGSRRKGRETDFQELCPDFSLFPAGHHPCPARLVRLLDEEAQTSRETAIENGFPPLTTLGGKEVDNSGMEV